MAIVKKLKRIHKKILLSLERGPKTPVELRADIGGVSIAFDLRLLRKQGYVQRTGEGYRNTVKGKWIAQTLRQSHLSSK